MIVLPPWFFGPKMIVRFIWPARNLSLKVKYLRANLLPSRILLTPQLRGAFRSSSCCCCSYFECHTYNYSVNGQRALISPKLGTRTIVLGRWEYLRISIILFSTHETFHMLSLLKCRGPESPTFEVSRNLKSSSGRGGGGNTTICLN